MPADPITLVSERGFYAYLTDKGIALRRGTGGSYFLLSIPEFLEVQRALSAQFQPQPFSVGTHP